MNDPTISHRIHLCAATMMLVIFIALYLAHVTWRSRSFRLPSEPAPTNSKPICSFRVFRDIARSRADGFVSGNGTWKRNARGTPEYFQPDVCRFRHRINIPRGEVHRCIKRHRLKYVVFAGDSNSMRYFAAFQALLRDVGGHCLPLQVSIRYTGRFILPRWHRYHSEQKTENN